MAWSLRRRGVSWGTIFGLVLGLALLAWLLLPLLSTVRAPHARMQSGHNLRQIGSALHNYHLDFGHFPPAAKYGEDGKPLLSWRVLILPYLEADDLYKQFKLDEPWDFPHNLALLPEMPKIYKPTWGEHAPHATYYQLLVGEEAVFHRDQSVTLEQLKKEDGTSDTMIAAEAGEAVPWTKPVDLPFASDQPLPVLGGMLTEKRSWRQERTGSNVLFANGKVLFLTKRTDERTLRALITRNGGEKVDLDQVR